MQMCFFLPSSITRVGCACKTSQKRVYKKGGGEKVMPRIQIPTEQKGTVTLMRTLRPRTMSQQFIRRKRFTSIAYVGALGTMVLGLMAMVHATRLTKRRQPLSREQSSTRRQEPFPSTTRS